MSINSESLSLPTKYGQYTVVDTRHTGAYANVYQVVDEHGRMFALKVLYKDKLPGHDREACNEIIGRFRQAPEINAKFPDDPRFLKHFGPVEEPTGNLFYASEWLESTVWDYAREHNGLTLVQILELFQFLVSVLADMHKACSSHRDLHLGQILLRGDFREGNFVLSDFDTFMNPSNPITYRLGGHITRVQPSLRRWFRDTQAPAGIVPQGADQRTDVYQLGVTIAEAISKKHFLAVQLEDIEGELLRSVRVPFVRLDGRLVNILKFAELVGDMVKERVVTIEDVRDQFERFVLVTGLSRLVGRTIGVFSWVCLSIIGILYVEALQIVGRAEIRYLLSLTGIYAFLTAVGIALLTRGSVDIKGLPDRLLLLLRGSVRARLSMLLYLLLTAGLLFVFTFSSIKGDLYLKLGMTQLGYDENCKSVLSLLESSSGDQVRDLANFERYLDFYTEYLRSSDSSAASDVSTLADHFRRLSNYSKQRIDVPRWVQSLEAARLGGGEPAPLILADLIRECYLQSRSSRELNAVDTERILAGILELGDKLKNDATRQLLSLTWYFERASWEIIVAGQERGDWEQLKNHKDATKMLAAASENAGVIHRSDTVTERFFVPGGYRDATQQRYLQRLCSADLFTAGRLALHLELDGAFRVRAESPRNRVLARDVAHLLQCRRYQGKQLLVSYYSNTLGDAHTLTSLSEERMNSLRDLVAEFRTHFGVSGTRLEHVVLGPVDHLYDPYRQPQLNARIELSLMEYGSLKESAP